EHRRGDPLAHFMKLLRRNGQSLTCFLWCASIREHPEHPADLMLGLGRSVEPIEQVRVQKWSVHDLSSLGTQCILRLDTSLATAVLNGIDPQVQYGSVDNALQFSVNRRARLPPMCDSG